VQPAQLSERQFKLSPLVWQDAVWALLLALVAFVVYSPTLWHDFAFLDDHLYVSRIYQIHRSLNAGMVREALTSLYPTNWHPLTLVSHALDCSLYGHSPMGHHATNLLLHSLATTVLFLLLRRLQLNRTRALIVAVLFGLHPLQVETVAWIASRKGLLSTLFAFLTIWAHAEFASTGRRRFYVLGLGAAALALSSKSMVVTLPLLLLVVDYWPLNRWQQPEGSGPGSRRDQARRAGVLVLEKLPYALLSVGCVAMTLKAHVHERVFHDYSWPARVANAFHSYVVYIQKAVWPSGLSIYYPHAGEDFSRWLFLLDVLLVVTLLYLAWKARNWRPAFTSGWIWYFVSLLPVLGLIPIDGNGWADRYAYLPLVGFFWAIVGLIPDKWLENPVTGRIVSAVAFLVVMLLGVATLEQVRLWRNSETLFGHALVLNESNGVAHVGYASGMMERGDLPAAEQHVKLALELDPSLTWAETLLGTILFQEGRYAEAERVLKQAVNRTPDSPDALGPLAWTLLMQKRTGEAVLPLKRLVEICPRHPAALHSLARVLAALNRPGEALPYLERAAQLEPNRPNLQEDLARARSATRRQQRERQQPTP